MLLLYFDLEIDELKIWIEKMDWWFLWFGFCYWF